MRKCPRLGEQSVHVRAKGSSGVVIRMSSDDIVMELKRMIQEKMRIPWDRQCLVCRGLVMIDEISLSYYSESKFMSVHLVMPSIRPNLNREAIRATEALSKLVSEMDTEDSVDFSCKKGEIADILGNKILNSYSKLNSSVKKLIETADDIINSSFHPKPSRFNREKALIADRSSRYLDTNPNSYRCLLKIDNSVPFDTTFIVESSDYVSSMPLPTLWCDESSQGSAVRNEKLLPTAIERLKALGFSNMDAIIDALNEANGDIQKAIYILSRNSNIAESA